MGVADGLAALGEWVTWPEWPIVACPICKIGQLYVVGDETVVQRADSERLNNHPGWEPEWVVGYFQGQLRCGRPSCGEPVIVSGDYSVDYNIDEKVELRTRIFSDCASQCQPCRSSFSQSTLLQL